MSQHRQGKLDDLFTTNSPSAPAYRVGDRVRVVNSSTDYNGQCGVVVMNTGGIHVRLDQQPADVQFITFYEHELTPEGRP